MALPERYLSDGAVEDAVDSTRCRPRKFALHDSFASLARAVEQRQQGLSAARELHDAAAQCLIGSHAKQGLRGRIQIADMQALIEQKNAGHQGIEELGSFDVN